MHEITQDPDLLHHCRTPDPLCTTTGPINAPSGDWSFGHYGIMALWSLAFYNIDNLEGLGDFNPHVAAEETQVGG